MALAADSNGTAIIVVDPGMSGFSMKVAEKFGEKLEKKYIRAKIIKAKEFQAAQLDGAGLLVMGGPTYATQPSGALKQALGKIKSPGMKTILFQTGGRDCAGLAPLVQMAEGKDLTVIGSGAILFNRREANYLDDQVNRLLEKI